MNIGFCNPPEEDIACCCKFTASIFTLINSLYLVCGLWYMSSEDSSTVYVDLSPGIYSYASVWKVFSLSL